VPLADLFVDIDEFKSINNPFGRTGCECVLKTMAWRIEQSLRKRDWAAWS
jgi:diguanylate cyclase (GGDEF)-like protein